MAEFFVRRVQHATFSDRAKLTDLFGRHFIELSYSRWIEKTEIILDPSRRKKIEIKEVE